MLLLEIGSFTDLKLGDRQIKVSEEFNSPFRPICLNLHVHWTRRTLKHFELVKDLNIKKLIALCKEMEQTTFSLMNINGITEN